MNNVNIYLLKASGRLNKLAEEIERNANEAVNKVAKVLPISDVDVVIYDNPKGDLMGVGIGGYTWNPNLVFVSLNPGFNKFEWTIKEELERSIAHELHHVARWQKIGYGKTLLEALISEGLADHFEIEVTGKSVQAWDRVLNVKDVDEFLKEAEKEFNSTNYSHSKWFFGDSEIPKWAGYSLGFKLVDEYLKRHPDKKSSDLIFVSAQDFLSL